jgi:predicted Zn-dependent protease
VVLNNSVPNAWALPGGKIAINRGLLLELGSEAELAAVLGHEIVHAAARHGAKNMERGMMLQGAILAAGIALDGRKYSQLALGAASIGANMISQRYSRDAELESDHYGIRYMAKAGYDPHAAVDLQQTFVRLSEGQQQNWLAGLFASHPPSPARVQANRETIQRLGLEGGEMGRDRYQRMIADLKRSKPAYDAYDEGVEALAAGDSRKALQLAQKAIRIEPREGLFHDLKGDALEKQGDERGALAAYDRAVSLNPGFFAHYLKRGMLNKELGRQRQASSDLQQSLQLLPTGQASYQLGELSLASGNRSAALAYFQQASDGAGELGKAAAQKAARLDLGDNPQRYIEAGFKPSNDGRAVLVLNNKAPIAVRNLRVRVGVIAGNRLQDAREYRVSGTLASGRGTTLNTHITGIDSPEKLRRIGAQILSAQPAQ